MTALAETIRPGTPDTAIAVLTRCQYCHWKWGYRTVVGGLAVTRCAGCHHVHTEAAGGPLPECMIADLNDITAESGDCDRRLGDGWCGLPEAHDEGCAVIV